MQRRAARAALAASGGTAATAGAESRRILRGWDASTLRGKWWLNNMETAGCSWIFSGPSFLNGKPQFDRENLMVSNGLSRAHIDGYRWNFMGFFRDL